LDLAKIIYKIIQGLRKLCSSIENNFLLIFSSNYGFILHRFRDSDFSDENNDVVILLPVPIS